MSGMSVRCSLAASFSIMGCCDMVLFPLQFKDASTSEISNLQPRNRANQYNSTCPASDSRFSRSFAANLLFADSGQKLFVFLTQRLPLQQVRAIPQRLFQRFP